MKQTLIAATALALAGAASAGHEKIVTNELVSKRMAKRQAPEDGDNTFPFFHINDVHAHLDEFYSSGADCVDKNRGCFGGYARIKHAVEELRSQHDESLWLNVGDEFQGTLYYTYYGPEKIGETLNQLGFDAMTLGNHEFDGGDDELGEFLLNLTFPVTSANIESDHPALNATILPYVLFEEYGVAVIGVTTPTTTNIANPGPGTKFHDVVSSVQASIDYIKANTDIKKIVGITHIGYDEDKALAAATKGLSLIMGGHSHTPLGIPGISQGDYPTIIEDVEGNEVFIVQAYRWGEYLGFIDVTFDAEGHALSYTGGPIRMTNTTEQDEDLQRQIKEWAEPFVEFAGQVVGSATLTLQQSTCQTQECNLGNVMSDAITYYRAGTADFALINAGGIRSTIDAGNITRGDVLRAFPFGNTIVELTYTGADVIKIFEGCVSRVNQFNGNAVSSGFQVSESIKVVYNPAQPAGSKIVRVLIDGEPIDPAASYVMATLDFLAGGGDNILVTQTGFIPLDKQDDVLTRYLAEFSPIDTGLEGRIQTTDELPGGGATTTSSAPTSTRTCIPRPKKTDL